MTTGSNEPLDAVLESDSRNPKAKHAIIELYAAYVEIARWLLDRGMDADAPAAIDANGFGGHTALFGAVVSYPHFWMNFTGGWASSRKPQQAAFAQLLLDHGADPNARASFRDFVKVDGAKTLRDLRDITPLPWGEAFHNKMVVSEPAMRLVAPRGGRR